MAKRGGRSKESGSRRKTEHNNRRTKHVKEKRDVLLVNSVFSVKGSFFSENVKHVHIINDDIILTDEELLILSYEDTPQAVFVLMY